MPEQLRNTFESGVDAVFRVYEIRGMDVGIGLNLRALIEEVGYEIRKQEERSRMVNGASPEALYQRLSARQLATSTVDDDPALHERLIAFSECFQNQRLRYKTRTTIAVVAVKKS